MAMCPVCSSTIDTDWMFDPDTYCITERVKEGMETDFMCGRCLTVMKLQIVIEVTKYER